MSVANIKHVSEFLAADALTKGFADFGALYVGQLGNHRYRRSGPQQWQLFAWPHCHLQKRGLGSSARQSTPPPFGSGFAHIHTDPSTIAVMSQNATASGNGGSCGTTASK